ncbi:MAG: hypothetical protein HQL87_17700 [Magnetococcales bacterium]|nr:hypothetical protein [Magnetococcales bacterium]
MLKTLIVWFVVIFLRKFGINVNKKEVAPQRKVYSYNSTVRIERRIDKPVPVAMAYGQSKVVTRVPERVALYNKDGNLIRLNGGFENRRYSAI